MKYYKKTPAVMSRIEFSISVTSQANSRYWDIYFDQNTLTNLQLSEVTLEGFFLKQRFSVIKYFGLSIVGEMV